VWSLVEKLLVEHPGIEFVEPLPPTKRWVLEDSDDDWVIQCAVTAKVDYIVSGDKAVLGLGEAEGIRIVSAARFVDEILSMTP
jgi:predicted nucleic acid-binding protein